MDKSKLEVKKKWLRWILFLGVIPFEKAALTIYYSNQIGTIISYLLILLVTIKVFIRFPGYRKIISESRYKDINNIFIVFILLFVVYIFNGLLNDDLYLNRLISLVTLLFYYVYTITEYEDLVDLTIDISKAALFLVIISLGMYLLGNPNVLYQESVYILSFKGVALNRNGFIEFAIIPIVTSWYNAINRKAKILNITIIIICSYAIVITRGATSIICLVVLLVLLTFRKLLQQRLTIKAFLCVYGIVFTIITIVNTGNNWLLEYISILFGKSSTLTGRITFWPTTIDLILKKPFWGYGIDTTILANVGIIENDPHNGILYLLLTSGIIGLFIFLIIIFRMLNRASEVIRKDNFMYCIMAFIFTWLIRGLVESPFSYTHFIFWTFVIIVFRVYRSEIRN